MRKLKAQITDNLIAAKATSAEIDFVLYLSHYQNDAGIVRGVYYQDVCEALSISPQTFYNVKKSLEEKGIIRVAKNFYADWDIQIVGNDFSECELHPGKPADNYLNTSLDIFYNQEFYQMKANEKLMAMLYVRIAGAGSPNYHIGTAHFYDKYTKLFGVKKRTLQDYLSGIKKFFAIGVKNREYWISPLRKKAGKTNALTDKAERAKQIGNSICRRFRLEEAKKAYKAVKELTEQYTYSVKGDIEYHISNAVQEVLCRINNTTEPPKWKKRLMNQKLLHKVFLELLPIECRIV